MRLASIRSEPYRLFFPLAALIGAVGVGTWLLLWLGWQQSWHGPAHGLAQSQAFLMSFVVGFLLTMIPRRLGAAAPSWFEMGACLLGLVGAAACAFADLWLASQACALLVSLTLLVFAVRRIRGARVRMPDAFLLLPLGLLAGAVGSVLIAVAHAGGPAACLDAGRGLVQEAQFLALILGAGHLVLPVLAGYPPPSDGDDSWPSRRRRLAHAGVALALVAGVLVERLSPGNPLAVRMGLLVRAAAFTLDAAWCAGGLRWPRVPGLHRRLGVVAFWAIPLGLLLAAALPDRRVAALHVTFVAGFALLSFAVATHVVASHGGHAEIVSGSPRALKAFAVLLVLAALTRVSADFLGSGYLGHLGWASVLWMLALGAWALIVVPRALRLPGSPGREVELPVLRGGAGPDGHDGRGC